jgi:transcriptional regulator with XRE-family HTH domain
MVVTTWTGLEAKLLRQARRMTLAQFSAHLGVTDRMISKWEAGGRLIRPRPVHQETLDESLRRCTDAERERFVQLVRDHERVQRSDQRMRWCLLVEVSPGDEDLAAELEMAVGAVLDGVARGEPST